MLACTNNQRSCITIDIAMAVSSTMYYLLHVLTANKLLHYRLREENVAAYKLLLYYI